MSWSFLRRFAFAAALLPLAACGDGAEPIDPTNAAVPAPTPYNLVIPTGFPPPAVLPVPAIPVDNPLTNEGVALGRLLFYETKLSRDNSMSCGSCHQQSKAFTDGRARAVGLDGNSHPRGAMSLANLLWQPRLNWDGSATSLEVQARTPIENPVELHQPLGQAVAKLQATAGQPNARVNYPAEFRKAFGTSTITEELLLKALAQFERTLISANSRFDRYRQGERALLSAGVGLGLAAPASSGPCAQSKPSHFTASMMLLTYSVSSFSGLVSSKRRWQTPP